MLPGERGQSVQIGAVLLFAMLILLLATYQAFLVPQQNEQVEFNHNEQVVSDLGDLRNALVSTVGDVAPRSVSITMGTRFPERIVAVNPPRPSGTLRTAGTADGNVNVTLTNARAVDGETADFWNGEDWNASTGSIVYRPEYSEYERPPSTVYEHSVLFDRFATSNVTRSGQSLVDGRRISIVTVNGSLSTTQSDTLSVDVEPISASTKTVTITNETGGNVTVRVPTRLSEDTWEELLEDERDEGHVAGVETRSLAGIEDRDLLIVDLEGNVNYTLRMGKAGVGTRTTDEDEQYLTGVEGDGATLYDEGEQQLTVEVRDRYNNPVGGVAVDAAANGTGSLDAGDGTTGTDGRVTFRYEAPAADDIDGEFQSVRVNATIPSIQTAVTPDDPSFDGSAPENVTFELTVRNTDALSTRGSDDTQPEVRNGDWPSTVTSGEDLKLNATADDRSRGGLDIASAEWFRVGPLETRDGQDPGKGNANQMRPTDGEFDHAWEDVEDTTTANWVSGDHTIVIRANDTNNDWGAETATVTVEDTTAPSISNVSLSDDGSGNLAFSFDSDEPLETVNVSVNGPNTNDAYTFDGTDFTSSDADSYTYTLTTTQAYDDGNGTYTATVDDATDAGGNNGGENGDGSGLSDGYLFGSSDSTPPSVTVNAPNGDELLRGGSTYTIEWSASDGESGIASNSIDLAYSTDGGSTWSSIATDEADDGSYDWSVPTIDNTDTLIRVTGEDVAGNSDSDTSDDTFAIDSTEPSVTGASITNAPISDADTGGPTQTVTVSFDEQMDTSQPLDVSIAGLASSPYEVTGSWSDDTTWSGTVSISDDEEETTATIEVAGGRDSAGNTQSSDPDTTNTFTVDTLTPGTPNEVVIEPDLIDQDNQNSVDVTVTLPATVRNDETVVVELADENGDTVTVEQPLSAGQGGTNVTVTIDVSSLADGTITPTTYVEDDVGNTGSSSSNDATTKDTEPPVVEEFIVTDQSTVGSGNSPTDVQYAVGFAVSDRTLSSVEIELIRPDGTVTETESLGTSSSGDVTLGDQNDEGESEECGSGNRPSCGDYEIRITLTDQGNLTTQRSVTDGPDGSGGSAAAVTSYVGESGTATVWGEERVDFDVETAGGSAVTVTGFRATSENATLTEIREESGGSDQAGQHEVYIDASTPGLFEADGAPYSTDNGTNGYRLGDVTSLTEEATLTGSEQAQVTLLEFRDGSGQTVSAADDSLTVSLYFDDGSVGQYTFTPPGY